ncbi:MAG: efflux RND transporter periplasmic adaptor subunit [bacterium]
MRVGILILIALLMLTGCGGTTEEGKTVLPTVPVQTAIAEIGDIQQTREFTGGLEGIEQADVYIRLSEAITALPFAEGAKVKAGQVIVQLDKGGASSGYYQAEAAFANVRKTYEKMKKLYDEGAVSESQFDDAEAAYEVAKANYDSAKELVEISAPISGVLADLNVQVGQVPAIGTLAARVARSDSLRVTFGVPASLLSRFRKGMTGEVSVASVTEKFTGKVTDIASAADPATRTFAVELTLPNPEGKLQPGTFAKVKFVIDSKSGVIAVDRNALLSTEGIYSLFVVRNDTAYSRSVTIGIVNDIHTEIASGLEAGEEVVTLGQNFLADGYPIVRAKEGQQ